MKIEKTGNLKQERRKKNIKKWKWKRVKGQEERECKKGQDENDVMTGNGRKLKGERWGNKDRKEKGT